MIKVVKMEEEKVVIDKELAYILLHIQDIASGLFAYKMYKDDPEDVRRMYLLESVLEMNVLAKKGMLEKGWYNHLKELSREAMDKKTQEVYDKLENEALMAFLHAVTNLTDPVQEWFVDLEEYLEGEGLIL